MRLILFIIFLNSITVAKAQTGLTFNRVVVIDTTLSNQKYSNKYYPPPNTVWKIEAIVGSSSNGIPFINDKKINCVIPYGTYAANTIYPIWIDNKSYVQLFNNYSGSNNPVDCVISILEFKID